MNLRGINIVENIHGYLTKKKQKHGNMVKKSKTSFIFQ